MIITPDKFKPLNGAAWNPNNVIHRDDGGMNLKMDKTGRGACVVTSGLLDCMYANLNIRARLPRGTGLHATLYLLGNNAPKVGGGGASGEIDIMETYGKVSGTSIYSPGRRSVAYDPGTDDHTYSLKWSKGRVETLIDGKTMAVWTPTWWEKLWGGWKLDKQPMFLVFELSNSSVQRPDKTTVLPAYLEIQSVEMT